MAITPEAISNALQSVADPNTGKDFVSTRALKNLQISEGDVSFDIELGYPAKSQHAALRKALVAAAKTVPGVDNVSVNITTKVISHAVQRGVQLMPNVKNIVAVASGKGGVGKSTTAANLALALAAEGARVGLLDAKKGIKMFEKVGVPILGLVENMAVHVCSNCGHVEHIFGADGGRKLAEQDGMAYLGALPLSIDIRLQADSGKPTVVADPEGEIAGLYRAVALQVAVGIAEKAKDFSAKFPTITVSTST